MCGIIAAASERNVGKLLVQGLHKMEYRGYDSAGIALHQDDQIAHLRTLGKVRLLEEKMINEKPRSKLGIAHTRWATHGEPSEENAHPHKSNERIYIVHNGIIENYIALKEFLKEEGYSFSSQTDSELIAHMLEYFLNKSNSMLDSMYLTIEKLEGAFAIAAIDREDNKNIIIARSKSPLLIGIGTNEILAASDPIAISQLTNEFIFAVIKGHEVEEGYLVTGMLVPLIVPVDLPLWMLAVSVIFGVVIGKEVFGGTGMNILNPALTIRAFLFFAYPTWMSGDKVWVHDAVNRAGTPEAISGETILGSYAQNQDIIYSLSDMFFGYIPGSVGETSKILIIFGALFLIFSKIGSWRIILSTLIGALVMGLIFNGVIDSGLIDQSSKFYGLMSVPYWQHLLIGSILFGAVFMATDPVTAAQTNKGKWIYGFLIGFISIMIRVFNPAYPEGVFLAILLMNVFAPTIDHFVIQSNVKMRLNRLKIKSA